MGMNPNQYGLVLLKSFCIFLAWIMGFHALKHLPVSLYGVLDLSRVLLGTLLGVIVLHEILVWNQILGLALVAFGLLALKIRITGSHGKPKESTTSSSSPEDPDVSAPLSEDSATSDPSVADTTVAAPAQPGEEQKNTLSGKFVLMAFGSCVLNSISGLLDKILMKQINSSQLQFWYMLFLLAFYLLYVLITRTKITRSVWKNGWIWLLAIMFVIGDASLFLANADPESRVTIMTVVKQSACFVTILGGKFVFHEKGIGYRLFCASIIFCGIVLCVLAR